MKERERGKGGERNSLGAMESKQEREKTEEKKQEKEVRGVAEEEKRKKIRRRT